MRLKKMVWRVVDENFKTINLEQLKLKLGALLEEAINEIQRDKIFSKELLGCWKKEDETRMQGKDIQQKGILGRETPFFDVARRSMLVWLSYW